ncbi:MAG TPA: MBL fold metallo-hydrolase [Syntrophomonadaceae bacterium]|jgi:7,8-dihydropterin-6-yl-methyl-4-(beta-D-ribofuranosyl)aminobenzene 5'-phosphate synthase|nr:MBL fold metallo-hydrolase [Syntrophomonadaceae bacterium]
MDVDISILVENTTPIPGLIGEYGFSALVKVNEQAFLFDTGSGKALFSNAAQMGIRLDEVDDLVISHGHFDHTGAVLSFLQTASGKTVYCHPHTFTRRYSLAGQSRREISALFTREQVQQAGARLVLIEQFTAIHPGVYLTGTVPRQNSFEQLENHFFAEIDGELVLDQLKDDMAMVIDHPEGLIIISGCAHAGMVNIIDYARQQTGRNKVQAFIGGTHLLAASDERLQQTISYLQDQTVQQLVLCHCTGFHATSTLYQALDQQVIKGETGMNLKY